MAGFPVIFLLFRDTARRLPIHQVSEIQRYAGATHVRTTALPHVLDIHAIAAEEVPPVCHKSLYKRPSSLLHTQISGKATAHQPTPPFSSIKLSAWRPPTKTLKESSAYNGHIGGLSYGKKSFLYLYSMESQMPSAQTPGASTRAAKATLVTLAPETTLDSRTTQATWAA